MSAAETTGRKPRPLHFKIVLGLIVGTCLGLGANYLGARPSLRDGPDPLDVQPANGVDDRLDWTIQNVTDPVGKVFLRLVFMVVVPLVFSALTLGVVEIGDVRRLGSVGVRTLLFTVALSLTAVTIGIVLVNAIKPGAALPAAQREVLRRQYGGAASAETARGSDDPLRDALAKAKQAKPLRETLIDLIPENPLQEMVGALDGSSKGGGILAVMVFSLLIGIAITLTPARTRTLVGCLEGLFDVSMVLIGLAMRLAPYGVACLVFAITARLGGDILRALFWFVLTVVGGLAIHLTLVYSALVRAFAGISPRTFFRGVREAMLTAFGTSSSNATLPTALRVAEEDLRLPRDVSRFVLTIGATGNQNGTGLYEGVVVLFLAQVFGIELSVVQQVTVVLMAVLAGVGTAGVPGGSLPLIVILLQRVGIPAEGIGIILGIDRILDMCRTVVNVTGDLAIAACVSRGGGEPADQPQ